MSAPSIARKTNEIVIAVVKERAPGEQRVATVPEVVQKLSLSGYKVRVETTSILLPVRRSRPVGLNCWTVQRSCCSYSPQP
jgi:hypothetical protein